jgi:hypothetical protein
MLKQPWFDLALIRPRPEPAPRRLPPSPLATCATKVLRMRRLRLYRLIKRTEGTIGEIETELYRRGVKLTDPPRHRGNPPFTHPPRLKKKPRRRRRGKLRENGACGPKGGNGRGALPYAPRSVTAE